MITKISQGSFSSTAMTEVMKKDRGDHTRSNRSTERQYLVANFVIEVKPHVLRPCLLSSLCCSYCPSFEIFSVSKISSVH